MSLGKVRNYQQNSFCIDFGMFFAVFSKK